MLFLGVVAALLPSVGAETKRPNILLAIADDWGVHAGAYGDSVVKTPVFDRLAREGVLFENAHVSSPSCAPSRAALLTGQWHWRLQEAANLHGPIPKKHPLYTDLLEDAGYFVGFTRKGWGPGPNGEQPRNPAGEKFKDFAAFLKARPKGQPFCFWFGSEDPHRDYVKDSGAKSGIPLDKIKLPPEFPDCPEVRGDMADYYFEVQRFDHETGELIEMLRASGELENTIVIMTSDHGMPFPRAKSNLYDSGTRIPLAIHWPERFKGGFRVTDFVSLIDLAPTFLESAGLAVPEVVSGRSLVPQLTAGKGGRIDPSRDHVLTGKERHVPSQPAPDSGGYPCRAIRTDDYLLIRNFTPDRWPAGTGETDNSFLNGAWYGDCDNGPTKSYMIGNRDAGGAAKQLYDLSFGKRPEYELFDLRKDPAQVDNVATNPGYAGVLKELSAKLDEKLRASGDPRVTGGGETFDAYPYAGSGPRLPGARQRGKGKNKRKP